MVAHILKPSALAQPLDHPVACPEPRVLRETVRRTATWPGASGRRYVHTVYSLLECPPLPDASYLLVQRAESGARTVAAIDTCSAHHAALNLARVRAVGSRLGANEVHVHLLAATPAARMLATCDLRAAQFGSLSAERQATNS